MLPDSDLVKSDYYYYYPGDGGSTFCSSMRHRGPFLSDGNVTTVSCSSVSCFGIFWQRRYFFEKRNSCSGVFRKEAHCTFVMFSSGFSVTMRIHFSLSCQAAGYKHNDFMASRPADGCLSLSSFTFLRKFTTEKWGRTSETVSSDIFLYFFRL